MAIKFQEYVRNIGKASLDEAVDITKIYGNLNLNLSINDYKEIAGNVVKFYDAHSNEELKGFASEMEEDIDTIKDAIASAADDEKQGCLEIQKLIKNAQAKYVTEGNRRMQEIMKYLRSLVAKK